MILRLACLGLWASSLLLAVDLGVYIEQVEQRAVIRSFIAANCVPWFKDVREHPPDTSKDKRIAYMKPGAITACTLPKDFK
jgi:hypothetical protein